MNTPPHYLHYTIYGTRVVRFGTHPKSGILNVLVKFFIFSIRSNRVNIMRSEGQAGHPESCWTLTFGLASWMAFTGIEHGLSLLHLGDGETCSRREEDRGEELHQGSLHHNALRDSGF